MAKRGRRGKIVGDLPELITADLEERRRLLALMGQYSFDAIGARWGLSRTAIFNFAKANGLLPEQEERP